MTPDMNLIRPSHEIPSSLAEYPVVIGIPIQWGDQDAFGHVNNTMPIKWFESSRIAYLEQSQVMQLMRGSGLGPILVSTTCDYRKQLRYPDMTLIGGRIAKIGRTSMTMEHLVYSRCQDEIAAKGISVVVVFDYEKDRPVRMPDEIRAAVARTEGWNE